MIQSKGSKVYSVKAIKDMAQTGYTEDFIRYLDRMPESIRKMIMSWTSDKVAEGIDAMRSFSQIEKEFGEIVDTDETRLEHLEITDNSKCSDEDIYESSYLDSYEDYDGIETSEVVVQTVDEYDDEDIVDTSSITSVNEEKHDYYGDFSYSTRITADKLFARIVNDDYLNTHDHKLVKRQVVISYDDNKKYGMMLYTCDVCREVFILESELSEYETEFTRRNIDYEFYR